jgi:hypothetical protein
MSRSRQPLAGEWIVGLAAAQLGHDVWFVAFAIARRAPAKPESGRPSRRRGAITPLVGGP